MIYNLKTTNIIFIMLQLVVYTKSTGGRYEVAGDHSIVTDKELFPYVVAILKMSSYVSAGAVVGQDWVLTAADGLYLVRESMRLLRVRVGSVNYRKSGSLLPIKYFRVHPYFDDSKPGYDVALVRLAASACSTPAVRPIRLLRRARVVTATHFIVTAWTPHYTNQLPNNKDLRDSMEVIVRSRMLSAHQVHPMEHEDCRNQQNRLGFNKTDTLLCLDPFADVDPCKRDAGAPVVLNGVLWGIMSSWKTDNCAMNPTPRLVNVVASPNISSWIDAVMQDLHWKLMEIKDDEENYI